MIPVAGGMTTQITFDPADDQAPDWSPDGNLLAFESNRSGNYDIWVITAPGTVALEDESWGLVKSRYRH
jgi:Tol biopolymer transport system component